MFNCYDLLEVHANTYLYSLFRCTIPCLAKIVFNLRFSTGWLAAVNLPEANSVPFLPVNPHLSSTRNQGRQKLARFTSKEFATLIIDILTEASQRHSFANSPKPQGKNFLQQMRACILLTSNFFFFFYHKNKN